MSGRHSESGQLLLPILAVMLLFGLFWVTYVLWCRSVYWRIRMDFAADATALSAAREEASMLNYIATFQMAENAFLPEIKDYGVMQVGAKPAFDGLNHGLQLYEESFGAQVLNIAHVISKLNGSDMPAFPTVGTDFGAEDDFKTQLKAHSVKVFFFSGPWGPVGAQVYNAAYYTRAWSAAKVKAQPPHESRWTACHESVCQNGRAHLWLDVDPSSKLNNGGFPSADESLLRSVGIQCFYPQFNARLLAKH